MKPKQHNQSDAAGNNSWFLQLRKDISQAEKDNEIKEKKDKKND